VNSLAKTNEMINFLKDISNDTTFESLKEGVNGIFDTIANSLIVKFLIFYNFHKLE